MEEESFEYISYIDNIQTLHNYLRSYFNFLTIDEFLSLFEKFEFKGATLFEYSKSPLQPGPHHVPKLKNWFAHVINISKSDDATNNFG